MFILYPSNKSIEDQFLSQFVLLWQLESLPLIFFFILQGLLPLPDLL